MITAAQIKTLRDQHDDIADTRQLKSQLAHVRKERSPFYLRKDDFEEILLWKLGQQIGRQTKRREHNTDEIIRRVTGLALTISHKDRDYELELRMSILCALRGVAVPVASAVLALVYPNEYAVIDFRGWRQVFGEDRRVFSIPDYKRYVHDVRQLAEELNWPVQEVDHAIWEFDRRNGGQLEN